MSEAYEAYVPVILVVVTPNSKELSWKRVDPCTVGLI